MKSNKKKELTGSSFFVEVTNMIHSTTKNFLQGEKEKKYVYDLKSAGRKTVRMRTQMMKYCCPYATKYLRKIEVVSFLTSNISE